MANTHEVLGNVKAYTLELLGTQFRDAAEDAANRSESGATRSESAADRSESARDIAESTVADALNNAAGSVRDEVKADADRAEQSAASASMSEFNAAASETSAGDYAAVATTAAAEAVDAMERATDLAGGDFATHEYVDGAVANVLHLDTTVGARVFFGDQMIYGDSGLRGLHSADSPPPLGSGTVRIRRVTNQVYMTITAFSLEDVTSSNDVIFTIPQGFRPESSLFSMRIENRASTSTNTTLDISVNGNVTTLGSRGASARLYLSTQWTTGDAWPATLPGTPI